MPIPPDPLLLRFARWLLALCLLLAALPHAWAQAPVQMLQHAQLDVPGRAHQAVNLRGHEPGVRQPQYS